jgi:hypothetical protein
MEPAEVNTAFRMHAMHRQARGGGIPAERLVERPELRTKLLGEDEIGRRKRFGAPGAGTGNVGLDNVNHPDSGRCYGKGLQRWI